MKNKIKELMVITTNSKTLEEFKENFKKGYLELLDFDEINRLNKEEDRLYNSIDKVINGKKFEKDKEKVVFALRDLLEALNELEKNAMKPLVKLENTGNKELEDKMNGILEVFHEITKTHDNNLNRNGQTALEVRDITNKEFAILNLIYKKIGQEEFNKLGVSWNPYIGLFIPSKDGFDKEKQVLMMSHLDLVPTFERAHEKVEKGELASALTIMDDQEINENTIIAGSLDNTMTNAVLLKNYLDEKLNNNVNMLFETDEESGMSGTRHFFKEEKEKFWKNISVDNNEMIFKDASNPKIKNDLTVINLDVTMGYNEPCAIETKRFSNKSNKELLEKFPILAQREYSPDDSTSTVKSGLVSLSYCVNVGTSYNNLEDGRNKFSGGCHSMDTYSSIYNVLSYSDLMPDLVKTLNQEIKIDLKEETYSKNLKSYYEAYNDFEYTNHFIIDQDIAESLVDEIGVEKQGLIDSIVLLLETKYGYSGDKDFYNFDDLSDEGKKEILKLIGEEDMPLDSVQGDIYNFVEDYYMLKEYDSFSRYDF